MTDDIRNCDDLDARLAGYVDGEATAESRAAVAAHLAACPPCRKHADEESAARQIVHEHRAALHVTAPAALRVRCQAGATVRDSGVSGSGVPGSQAPGSGIEAPGSSAQRSRSAFRKWAPLSLAATLLLAVGGVFLFGLNNRVQALALSLTVDHIKCFAMRPSAPIEPADAARRWRQDQGWPITVPQTEPAEQLKLIGLRRCFSADGRVAHMMYMWHGAPLSVYVVQADAGRDCVIDRMGREAVIWCAKGRTYAVIADGHPDLQHIADYMKGHIQ
ncbi:MAG TPA: zf-HC2 domain-containing protein [Vicinamibacterales bacterium]